MNSLQLSVATVVFLSLTQQAAALPDTPTAPELVTISAKFAQAKARLRAYEREADTNGTGSTDGSDPFSMGSQGCDVNIGNVDLSPGADAPDEVVVIVTGDIIQANNCR